jgi:hypothetical protein
VDGVNFSVPLVLSEGTSVISVRLKDAAGNVGTILHKAYTLDTVGSNLEISQLVISDAAELSDRYVLLNTESPNFTGSLLTSLASGEYIEYRVDNGIWAHAHLNELSSLFDFTVAALGEGEHTISMRVGDQAGNTGQVVQYNIFNGITVTHLNTLSVTQLSAIPTVWLNELDAQEIVLLNPLVMDDLVRRMLANESVSSAIMAAVGAYLPTKEMLVNSEVYNLWYTDSHEVTSISSSLILTREKFVAWLNGDEQYFPLEMVKYILPTWLENLTDAQLAKFDVKMIWEMNVQQLGMLNVNRLDAFSILALTNEQVTGLNFTLHKPWVLMDTTERNTVPVAQMVQLPPQIINTLTKEELGALDQKFLINLTLLQWLGLTHEKQILFLSQNEEGIVLQKPFFLMNAEEIANIPANLIKDLAGVDHILPWQLSAFQQTQLIEFTPDQIRKLSVVALNGLSAEKRGYFSLAQLNAMSLETKNKLDTAWKVMLNIEYTVNAETFLADALAYQVRRADGVSMYHAPISSVLDLNFGQSLNLLDQEEGVYTLMSTWQQTALQYNVKNIRSGSIDGGINMLNTIDCAHDVMVQELNKMNSMSFLNQSDNLLVVRENNYFSFSYTKLLSDMGLIRLWDNYVEEQADRDVAHLHVVPSYMGDMIRSFANVFDNLKTQVRSFGALEVVSVPRVVGVSGDVQIFDLEKFIDNQYVQSTVVTASGDDSGSDSGQELPRFVEDPSDNIAYVNRLRSEFWRLVMVYVQRIRLALMDNTHDVALQGANLVLVVQQLYTYLTDIIELYVDRLEGYLGLLGQRLEEVNHLLLVDAGESYLITERNNLHREITYVNALLDRDTLNIENFHAHIVPDGNHPAFAGYVERAHRPLIPTAVESPRLGMTLQDGIDFLLMQLRQRFVLVREMVAYPESVLNFQQLQTNWRMQFAAFLQAIPQPQSENNQVVFRILPAGLMNLDRTFADAYFERTYNLAQLNAYQTFLDNIVTEVDEVEEQDGTGTLEVDELYAELRAQRRAIVDYINQNTQGFYLDNYVDFRTLLRMPGEILQDINGVLDNPNADIVGESEFQRVHRRFWGNLLGLTNQIRLMRLQNTFVTQGMTAVERGTEAQAAQDARSRLLSQYQYFLWQQVRNATTEEERHNALDFLMNEVYRIEEIIINHGEFDPEAFEQGELDIIHALTQRLFIGDNLQNILAGPTPVAVRIDQLQQLLFNAWTDIYQALALNHTLESFQENYAAFVRRYLRYAGQPPDTALAIQTNLAMQESFNYINLFQRYVEVQVARYNAYLDELLEQVEVAQQDAQGHEDYLFSLNRIITEIANQRTRLAGVLTTVRRDVLIHPAFEVTAIVTSPSQIVQRLPNVWTEVDEVLGRANALRVQIYQRMLRMTEIDILLFSASEEDESNLNAERQGLALANRAPALEFNSLFELIRTRLQTHQNLIRSLELSEQERENSEDVLERNRLLAAEYQEITNITETLTNFGSQIYMLESRNTLNGLVAEYQRIGTILGNIQHEIEDTLRKIAAAGGMSLEDVAKRRRYAEHLKRANQAMRDNITLLEESRTLYRQHLIGRQTQVLQAINAFSELDNTPRFHNFLETLGVVMTQLFNELIAQGDAMLTPHFNRMQTAYGEFLSGGARGLLENDSFNTFLTGLVENETELINQETLLTMSQLVPNDTQWLSSPFIVVNNVLIDQQKKKSELCAELAVVLFGQAGEENIYGGVENISANALSNYLNARNMFFGRTQWEYQVTMPSVNDGWRDLFTQKQNYIDQGQNVLGNTVMNVLLNIAFERENRISGISFDAYQAQQWQNLYSLNGNYVANLVFENFEYAVRSSLMSRQETALWRGIISASQTQAEKVSDIYLINGESIDARVLYAVNQDSDKKYDFAGVRHITLQSISAKVYDKGESWFVNSEDNEVYVPLIDRVNQAALVLIEAENNFNGVLNVDASGANHSMRFRINTDKAIISGGQNRNVYEVSAGLLGNYEIWGGASGQDAVIFDAGIAPNLINLDHLHDVFVFSRAFENHVVGTRDFQEYRSSGGSDTVTMRGNFTIVYVAGRGNTVNLAGIGNRVSVALGKHVAADKSFGQITGAALTLAQMALSTLFNTIDFSGSTQAITMQVDGVNGLGVAQKSSDVEGASDGVNFSSFQRIVGSHLGDIIRIINQTQIKELILGIGGVRGNVVLVEDTRNINVLAAMGSHTIMLNGKNAQANMFLETKGGNTTLRAFGNATVQAILSGANDDLDFTVDSAASFSTIETRGGHHTIKIGNNLGRKSIIVNDFYEENETVVVDQNTLGQNDQNCLIISISSALTNTVIYKEGQGLYIETTGQNQNNGRNIKQKLSYLADFANNHSQAIIKMYDAVNERYVYTWAKALFDAVLLNPTNIGQVLNQVPNLLLQEGEGGVVNGVPVVLSAHMPGRLIAQMDLQNLVYTAIDKAELWVDGVKLANAEHVSGMLNFNFWLEQDLPGRVLEIRVYDAIGRRIAINAGTTINFDNVQNINIDWLSSLNNVGGISWLSSTFWNNLDEAIVEKLTVDMVSKISSVDLIHADFWNKLSLNVIDALPSSVLTLLRDSTLIAELNSKWDTVFASVVSLTMYGVAEDMSLIEVGVGQCVKIELDFNTDVVWENQETIPYLNLSNGQKAFYVAGSGTSKLTFEYIVGGNQNSDNLSVVGWGEVAHAVLGVNGALANTGLTSQILSSATMQVHDTENVVNLSELSIIGGDSVFNASEVAAGIVVRVTLPANLFLAGDNVEILMQGESIYDITQENEILHSQGVITQTDIDNGYIDVTIVHRTADRVLEEDGNYILSAKVQRNTTTIAAGGNHAVAVDVSRPLLYFVESSVLGTINRSVQSVVFTYTFSQNVSALTRDNFELTNGAIQSVVKQGEKWLVTMLPAQDVAGELKLVLHSNSFFDVATNGNSAYQSKQPMNTILPDTPLNNLSMIDSDMTITRAEKEAGVVVRFSLANLSVHLGDGIEVLLNGETFANPVKSILRQADIDIGYVDINISNVAGWGDAENAVLSARIMNTAQNIGAAGSAVSVTLEHAAHAWKNQNKIWVPSLVNEITATQLAHGVDVVLDLTGINCVEGDEIEIVINGNVQNTTRVTLNQTQKEANLVWVHVNNIANLDITKGMHVVARVIHEGVVGDAGGSLVNTLEDVASWVNRIATLSDVIFSNVDAALIYAIPSTILNEVMLTKLAQRYVLRENEPILNSIQLSSLTGQQIVQFIRSVKTLNPVRSDLCIRFINQLALSQITTEVMDYLDTFLDTLSYQEKEYLHSDVIMKLDERHPSRNNGFLSDLLHRPFADRTELLMTPTELNTQIIRRIEEVEVRLNSVHIIGEVAANREILGFVEYLNRIMQHTLYPVMINPEVLTRIIRMLAQGARVLETPTASEELTNILASLLRLSRLDSMTGAQRLGFAEALSTVPEELMLRLISPQMLRRFNVNELAVLFTPWRVARDVGDGRTAIQALPTAIFDMLSDAQIVDMLSDDFLDMWVELISQNNLAVLARVMAVSPDAREIMDVFLRDMPSAEITRLIRQLEEYTTRVGMDEEQRGELFLFVFNHLSRDAASSRVVRSSLLRLMGVRFQGRISDTVLRMIPALQMNTFLSEDVTSEVRGRITALIRERNGEGEFPLVLTDAQWNALLDSIINELFASWLDDITGEMIPIQIIQHLPRFTREIIFDGINFAELQELTPSARQRFFEFFMRNPTALDQDILFAFPIDVLLRRLVFFDVSVIMRWWESYLFPSIMASDHRGELLSMVIGRYGTLLPLAIRDAVPVDDITHYSVALIRAMSDTWVAQVLSLNPNAFAELPLTMRIGLMYSGDVVITRYGELLVPRTAAEFAALTPEEIGQLDLVVLARMSPEVIRHLSLEFMSALDPAVVAGLGDEFVDIWLSGRDDLSDFSTYSVALRERIRWSVDSGLGQVNVRAALEYLGIAIPDTGVSTRMPEHLRGIGLDFYGDGFRGAGARVMVIDSGVLAQYRNSRMRPIHVVGNDVAEVFEVDGSHGTNMISVISAEWEGEDSVGGVVPDVTIYSAYQRYMDDVGRMILEAIRLDVDVISLSLGSNEEPYLVSQAVERAREVGIIIVAASGNSGRDPDAVVDFPARYARWGRSVFAIGATELDDTGVLRVADFSTRAGTLAPYSFLTAPGVDIPVHDSMTLPYVLPPYMTSRYVSSTYLEVPFVSGTSPATAMVSGVFGMLISAITRSVPGIARSTARLAAQEALLATATPLRLSRLYPRTDIGMLSGGSVGVDPAVLTQYMNVMAPRGGIDWDRLRSGTGGAGSGVGEPPTILD